MFLVSILGIKRHANWRNYSSSPISAHVRGDSEHRVENRVQCPGTGCSRVLRSERALMHHLASSACVSQITKATVDESARLCDTGHLIVQRSMLPSSSVDGALSFRWATDGAWNGSEFECYICKRAFKTLDGVNLHLLLSSKHDSRENYHCPNCGGKFTSLHGLLDHIALTSRGCARSDSRTALEKLVKEIIIMLHLQGVQGLRNMIVIASRLGPQRSQ